MSKFKIIKFKNLSPLHIGLGRNNYDFSSSILHSDTISAALASIRACNGKSKDIEQFLSSFAMSSAFPYFKDAIYLPLPKGRLNIRIQGRSENEIRKQLKKLQYAELSMWEQMAKGECLEIQENQIMGYYLNSPNKLYKNNFIKRQLTERVTVPTGDNKTAVPFFFEWTFFSKEAGLYVIVDAADEIFEELISLTKELGVNGIGSDRNVGGGHFEITAEEMSIDVPQNANSQILLSLFIPDKEELSYLDLKEAQYSLIQRGGFIAGSNVNSFRHLRRKSIYMFEEGSIFPTSKQLRGRVVDLAPSWNDKNMHKVLRSGKPFTLPTNFK